MKNVITLALLSGAVSAQAALINEFSPNPSGSDPSQQSLELKGDAGTLFSGWFLSVESDSGSSLGTVDRASEISGTFDANGLLTVLINDLENPSFTTVLVDSFSGSVGTDLDTDNDGVADDLSSLGTVLDAVGVIDNGTDPSYASQLGGMDLNFIGSEPVNVFRDSVTDAWVAVDFNGDVYSADAVVLDNALFNLDPTLTTFGSINPTQVPVPAAAWLFASGLLGLAGLRRKNKQ